MGYLFLLVALTMLVGLSSAFQIGRNARALRNTTEVSDNPKQSRVRVENLPRKLSSLTKHIPTPSDEDCTNNGQEKPPAVFTSDRRPCAKTWECVKASNKTTFPRFVYSVKTPVGPQFDSCKCKPLLYYPSILQHVARRRWKLVCEKDISIVTGFVCHYNKVTQPECHIYSC